MKSSLGPTSRRPYHRIADALFLRVNFSEVRPCLFENISKNSSSNEYILVMWSFRVTNLLVFFKSAKTSLMEFAEKDVKKRSFRFAKRKDSIARDAKIGVVTEAVVYHAC